MTGWKRARLVLALLVGLYLAQMYVGAGWDKFDPDGFWAAPFERWGYPVWLRLSVGAAEVVGGVAIVVPWVATWGALLLGAVMLGAGATRALDGRWGDVLWIGVFAAALAWVGWEWKIRAVGVRRARPSAPSPDAVRP